MKLKTTVLYFLIFAFTFALFSIFAIRGIDPHHDGLMLKTSMDVLSGQVLYKETFTQYGSLTTYFQALMLYLFGAKLISLKLGTVAVYSTTATLQFAIGRKYLPFGINLLAFFFWLFIAPFYITDWVFLSWSSSFALLCQMASILCFSNALDSHSRSKYHLFMCGLFAAMVMWCRVPAGLTLLLAYLIIFISCLILRKNSSFTNYSKINILLSYFKYFVYGYLVIQTIFFGLLIFTNSLSDWHFQVFIAPKKWLNNTFGMSLGRILWSLFYSPTSGLTIGALLSTILLSSRKYSEKNPTTRLIYITGITSTVVFSLVTFTNLSLDIFGGWASAIPIILLGFFVFSCYRIFIFKNAIQENHIIILWLSIIALSAWHQYFPVTCYRHIFWGITPAIIPFLMICLYLAKSRVNAVIIAVGVFLSPIFINRISAAKENLSLAYIKLDSPLILSGMFVSEKLHSKITAVNQTIETFLANHPNAPVLLDGGDALYNTFVKNLSNPEAMFVYWGYSDEESQQKRQHFIREQRPIIIIQNRPQEKTQEYLSKFKYTSKLNIDSMEVLTPNE